LLVAGCELPAEDCVDLRTVDCVFCGDDCLEEEVETELLPVVAGVLFAVVDVDLRVVSPPWLVDGLVVLLLLLLLTVVLLLLLSDAAGWPADVLVVLLLLLLVTGVSLLLVPDDAGLLVTLLRVP